MTLILGIESSCDETAASVVENGTVVKSSIIASQNELHSDYGGVVPEIASRAHLERILPIIDEALRKAHISIDELDAVAVGNRPGLIGSLLVGVAAAKSLAWTLQIPFIAVDHLVAHLYAPCLSGAKISYPAMGIIVSGGHTAILLLHSPTEATCISKTIDDAAGEAFDKAASIIGLGWPGGPLVDIAASKGTDVYHLPRLRRTNTKFNYSFSGLKTALLYGIRGIPKKENGVIKFKRSAEELTEQQRYDWAASFQCAVVDSIIVGIETALQKHQVQSIVAGGGVIANSYLRTRLKSLGNIHNLPIHLSDQAYCVDNAAMIAGLAIYPFKQGKYDCLSTIASPKGIAS